MSHHSTIHRDFYFKIVVKEWGRKKGNISVPWLESLKPKKPPFSFHNWDGWPGGGRKQSRSSTEVLRHWTSSVWRLLCQKRRGEGWCTTPRGWANFRFCWVVEFSRLSTAHIKKTKQIAALLFPSIPFHFFKVLSKNRRMEGNCNFEITISFHFYINFRNCYFLPFWLLFPSTFLNLLFPSIFL